MRIAQVAPLYESVPPQRYGGTERIVAYLCDEMVNQGHEVSLFASKDSVTKARLIPCCEAALWLSGPEYDPIASHFIQLHILSEYADEFDVIHFHTDFLHFPSSLSAEYCHLTTLHGRLDLAYLSPLYQKYNSIPLVSISNSQRLPIPDAMWMKTIYHGLPTSLYRAKYDCRGEYLCFIGRMSPEKRVDRAVAIAKGAGVPIKIAAKIHDSERSYFENELKPLFDDPMVEFIGEVDESQKEALLRDALGLVFPIDWPEPFGLVMIEAMACGTPVVAFAEGAVPEVIDEGLTGYVVNSVQEAIERIGRLPQLSRRDVRRQFEKRFSAERMTKDYLELYEELVQPRVHKGGWQSRKIRAEQWLQ